jgi:hypothetical protein
MSQTVVVQPPRTELGRYTDPRGRRRELQARPGRGGSTLVVDCDAEWGEPCSLVAHLGADEPPENAALVVRRYLEDERDVRGRCRPLTPDDARVLPFAEAERVRAEAAAEALAAPVDRRGWAYRLDLLDTGMSIPELRWRRHPGPCCGGAARTLSLREAIGRLEGYEPLRTLTQRALVRHGGDGAVSTTTLRAELERVQNSPIVLNRRLREVTLAIVGGERLSMSEIAMRCGRVKRDARGNVSGETSWLARRLGLLPEGGQTRPTPWIHSDVLALIARRGLGLSPREVEAV